jgi:hypothetical protein
LVRSRQEESAVRFCFLLRMAVVLSIKFSDLTFSTGSTTKLSSGGAAESLKSQKRIMPRHLLQRLVRRRCPLPGGLPVKYGAAEPVLETRRTDARVIARGKALIGQPRNRFQPESHAVSLIYQNSSKNYVPCKRRHSGGLSGYWAAAYFCLTLH